MNRIERFLGRAVPCSQNAASAGAVPNLADQTGNLNPGKKETRPPHGNSVEYTSTGGEDLDNVFISVNRGEYSSALCDSPESSLSEESMNDHVENKTPPDSPAQAESPGTAAVGQIGRLSLEQDRPEISSPNRRGPGLSNANPTTKTKRPASLELQRPPNKKSPSSHHHTHGLPPKSKAQKPCARPNQGRNLHSKRNPEDTFLGNPDQRPSNRQFYGQFPNANRCDGKQMQPLPRDSGYASAPSRESTLQNAVDQSNGGCSTNPSPICQQSVDFDDDASPQPNCTPEHPSARPRHLGLIRQPDSPRISPDQLAAEVKGIYSGLVMVEAKCMNVDAAQVTNLNFQMGPEQWQALIGLHRTLLYEHHDFLMASQHPAAPPALRGLATKYCMPARMWKHGIHAFLEVLRHRRPDSQDYMLAFIYLAYQMVALLYETVPAFIDTWIECLGDLARYRMAIEEEREAHAAWGGVAARWYNLASDRHPGTGRLNHHLGILERPSLRKLFLYSKALTTVTPFPNARDSLTTLCCPFAQDDPANLHGNSSAEASVMAFHAYFILSHDDSKVSRAANEALSRLNQQCSLKIREWGVPLVIVNIAAILEFGSPKNLLWQAFQKSNKHAIQSSRPSTTAPKSSCPQTGDDNDTTLCGTSPSTTVYDFVYTSFHSLIRLGDDRQSVRDVLPSVHIMLVWLHSLFLLESLTNNDGFSKNTTNGLMKPRRFDWAGLCNILNLLTQLESINARTMECARQGKFPAQEVDGDAKPLQEDYHLRGLAWTQFYFPPQWFNALADADCRAFEDTSTQKARVERVQWLGLYLAFRVDYIVFDLDTKTFKSSFEDTNTPLEKPSMQLDQATHTPSRPSATLSTHSDSDGYAVVGGRKVNNPSKASRKRKSDWQSFDCEPMQCA